MPDDYENRLLGVNKAGASYVYTYDYRTRRVKRVEAGTATKIVFSGGTSMAEYDAASALQVEYIRGSDWGGGVGGLLYSIRATVPSYTHCNSRGDVTAKTDGGGAVTWQAEYEAFGTHPNEVGATLDRQKANTKEEDPTGLLNEGFRYRDLETGIFITRDPIGFNAGPNFYTYVHQNPWTKFDPEGLVDNDAAQKKPNFFQRVGETIGKIFKGPGEKPQNPANPADAKPENSAKVNHKKQQQQQQQQAETPEQASQWKTEGTYPKGDPRFDTFMSTFLFSHEITLKKGKVVSENVSGDSGGLTKYGIDQAAHPNVDIEGLNKQRATDIYYHEWVASGASKMHYSLEEVYFDAKVNGGGDTLLKRSGGDPAKFIEMRQDRYRGLADKYHKKAHFLPGWLSRGEDLKSWMDTHATEPH